MLWCGASALYTENSYPTPSQIPDMVTQRLHGLLQLLHDSIYIPFLHLPKFLQINFCRWFIINDVTNKEWDATLLIGLGWILPILWALPPLKY
jgi:hypothetical protein